jgi:hypothetical protein
MLPLALAGLAGLALMGNPPRRRRRRKARRNPGLAPLEPLDDLPTIYHGSRDPKRVLREGYSIGPAINMVHYPEYAWTGCRSGCFTDGGGVNWKGYVWAWWKSLPLAERRRFQAEVGDKIARADDLGRHVQLLFTDKRREEAESYALTEYDDDGRTTKQHEPFALDATKIPNALGYFQPDINSRGETVIVLRLGPSDLKAALVAPVARQDEPKRGWRP